jgi:hypothetical protein
MILSFTQSGQGLPSLSSSEMLAFRAVVMMENSHLRRMNFSGGDILGLQLFTEWCLWQVINLSDTLFVSVLSKVELIDLLLHHRKKLQVSTILAQRRPTV